MSRTLNFILLLAFSVSADASLAALKALDKLTSPEDVAAYCAPQVSCSYSFGTVSFGPEEMSVADCMQKTQAEMVALMGDTYMIASVNPVPLSETVSGTQGVAVFAMTGCMQTKGDGKCVPGTTVNMEMKSIVVFDDQDKVVSYTQEIESAAASFLLNVNEAAARRSAMPLTGILITTFLLSALSIGCYQLGKKHGQAKVAGGYASLLDA